MRTQKLKTLKLFRKRDFIIVGFIIVFGAISISLFYFILTPQKTLPIYQPYEVNEKLVDSSISYISKYHKISDFELINQNGVTITQEYYKNKIYVADFFFTTCQSICPIMTKNMLKIQEQLKNDKEILLLSHTVTPEIDSVQQLKRYALENSVDDGKWNLVTGDKRQIYDGQQKALKVTANSIYGQLGSGVSPVGV